MIFIFYIFVFFSDLYFFIFIYDESGLGLDSCPGIALARGSRVELWDAIS